MISYMTCQSECRSVMLLEYFGEKKGRKCNMCDVCTSSNDNEDEMDYAVRRIMEYLADGNGKTYNELRDFDPKITINVLANAIDYLLSEEKVSTDGIKIMLNNV